MTRLPIVLALLLTMCACGPRPAPGPGATLMLAATGSLDRSADSRSRLPDGLRKVTRWTSQPPLAAGSLNVTYDTDARNLSWRADLTDSRLTLEALAGGPLQRVGSWQGEALYRIAGGPLRGNLAARADHQLTLMSAAYAVHYEPQAAALAGLKP